MENIGTYFKNIREEKKVSLQDVSNATLIDSSLLSRIENGKRMPTKEQALLLAKTYNVEEYHALVQWLSDKIVTEIADEKYGLEALKVAEKKVLLKLSNL